MIALLTHLKKIIFHQPNVDRRIALLRISIGVTCVILITFGPFGRFYVDTADFLYSGCFPFYFFPNLGRGFYVLKSIAILSGISLAAGFSTRFSSVIFAVTFSLFNFYVTCFGTTLWNYNTHLVFFSAALCFVNCNMFYSLDSVKTEPQETSELTSYVISFMQLYVGVLYLQSGLSKLIYGGVEWFLSGRTLLGFTIQMGSGIGMHLTRFPFWFKLFAVLTLIFELGFLPILILSKRSQPYLGVVGILFHLAVFTILGISFWFLWILYPALFILYNNQASRSPLKSV
jgi:hypothetical protein